MRIFFTVFRWGAVLWLALVGLFAGAQHLGFIDPAEDLERLGWLISLLIIAVESVGALLRDHLERNRAELKLDLDRAGLVFVLEQLRSNPQGLSFEDLGVSVWIPTKWSRVRGRLFGLSREQYRLKRLNRFRPDDYPQSSGISWQGDMGCLGKCWTQKKAQYHDNSRVARRWGGVEITDAVFEGIRTTTRQGFNREQFSQIVGKYSEVLAIPIMHTDPTNDTMIGVLTIDRVWRPEETPFIAHLDGISTLRRGIATAALVSSTVSGKR